MTLHGEDLCLLCRVARGELPAKTVLESERAIAVINTREPHAGGHVVVFPRRHAVALHEMSSEDVARYAREPIAGIEQEEWYRRVKAVLASVG